jgi:rod shape-determining protein MreC
VVVYRQDRRRRLTLVLLVITSLVLISLDERGSGILDTVRSAAQDVISPAQNVVDDLVNPVADFFDSLGRADELDAENAELRRRIAALEGEVERSRVAADENDSFREVFDIPQLEDAGGIVAEVVSGSVDNFRRTWRVNKGSNAGIEVNMPVVVGGDSGGALVGVVERVARNSAVIQRIDDREFGAGARVVQADGSGPLGAVQGLDDSTLLSFDPIDTRTAGVAIDEDQLVVTAGPEVGSVYPAGLPIGRIVRAVPATTAAQRDARVQPVVDLDSVDIVKILRPLPGSAP